ncbi:MAG TPA: hypothetical protein VM939_09315 [Gemmatimonadaceae bacterium]|nr:hypothetical protein [Gemmatimonadaceae bacterium]
MQKGRLVIALATMLTAACTQGPVSSEQPPSATPPGSNTGADNGLTGQQKTDWAAIEQLEQQAKALAKTAGCDTNESCRAAAVGSRACGGPRYYLPYCAKTTDSAALAAKLSEVAKAEQAYNQKYQLASTCEFRMPPLVESAGGSCVAR